MGHRRDRAMSDELPIRLTGMALERSPPIFSRIMDVLLTGEWVRDDRFTRTEIVAGKVPDCVEVAA